MCIKCKERYYNAQEWFSDDVLSLVKEVDVKEGDIALAWNTRTTDPLLEKMVEEIEQLRVQLAGCGVAALCNTNESMEQQRVNPGDYGYSASYQDVLNAVKREIKYRELLEKMAKTLEKSKEYLDEYRPHGHVLDQIEEALQEYREITDTK